MTNLRRTSDNAWRENPDSKYSGVSLNDVEQRAQEVIEKGGSQRDMHNAVRELTMYEKNQTRAFEKFQAGIIAGEKKLNEKLKDVKIEEK